MSYKETLGKLERLLAKIEDLSSDFTIDKKVYEEAYKLRLKELKDLLSKLCIGDWDFTVKGLEGEIIMCFKTLDIVREYEGYIGRWTVRVTPTDSVEDFRKTLFTGMVDYIKHQDDIQLDRFASEVVKAAEEIINNVDDEFYRDMIELYETNMEEYKDLEVEQSKTEQNTKEYSDRAQELLKQAVEEWFSEGRLTEGATVFFHGDDRPRKVISINGKDIYAKLVDQRYFSSSDTENVDKLDYKEKLRTWQANNPQLRADMILNPMQFVSK